MLERVRSVGCSRIIFYFIKASSLKMTQQICEKETTIQKNKCSAVATKKIIFESHAIQANANGKYFPRFPFRLAHFTVIEG